MGHVKNKIILDEEDNSGDDCENSMTSNKDFGNYPVDFSNETYFNFMYHVVAGKYSGYL